MIIGTIGLLVAYIVVISVGILVGLSRKFWFITIYTFFAIYFAIALSLTVENFSGWPSAQELPEESQIISFKIKEPSEDDKVGAFYFWLNLKKADKIDAYMALNPRFIFSYINKTEPRAFKMPYDRELHKKLLEAQKEKKKTVGGWLSLENKKGEKESPSDETNTKKEKKGKNKSPSDGTNTKKEKIEFKIMNPVEILSKEELGEE